MQQINTNTHKPEGFSNDTTHESLKYISMVLKFEQSCQYTIICIYFVFGYY